MSVTVNFTLNGDPTVVYEYYDNMGTKIINKYAPIGMETFNNHIQYLSLENMDNKFMFSTTNKNMFKPIFPRLKTSCDKFLAARKESLVYNDDDLLNLNRLYIKIMDRCNESVIINNLDTTCNTNGCNCSPFEDPLFSCQCYYLRHPLNEKFQIDIFIKLGMYARRIKEFHN